MRANDPDDRYARTRRALVDYFGRDRDRELVRDPATLAAATLRIIADSRRADDDDPRRH